ncbi:TRADD-N-associated membrane domain-containing protein [Clostridium tertium]
MSLGLIDKETYNNYMMLVKTLKNNPKERKFTLRICIIVVALSSVGLVINKLFFNSNQNIFIPLLIVLLISITILLACAMSYFDIKDSSVDKYLEALAEERLKLNEKIKEENESNVLDVIKINLNQLNEYYTINKAQARRSYSFSIAMIIIGFLVLIFSIMLWLFGKIGLNITIIATLSGLIAEFIGATSLLLYKESTRQIQLFFEKLSYLQHIMLAVELTERLNNDRKEEQIGEIISSLIVKK